MNDWTDAEFIDYVEAHSQTPRALFSKEQLTRLFILADQVPPEMYSGFYAFHIWDAERVIKMARARLIDYRDVRRSKTKW